jgi:cellulose synthase/poly-beta-1,6-N-acetylglucosamine synthase-like glycosyltransferase
MDRDSRSVLRGRERLSYRLLAGGWAGVNLLFWSWWLQPDRIRDGWLYVPLTLALAYYLSVLPSVYVYYVGKMRRPPFRLAAPGQRVALISPCVPASESLDVIRRQMHALLAVEYPHDSWILDEGGDAAVAELAARLGVKYFSRRGVARYNQPCPPFEAKTKAGNVNAWLDAHGAHYDIFVQLDVDHCPRPDYLHQVLGYFEDPRVAWVQAPSLYGNTDTWVARGAAEQELVLQGPLQMGFYGSSETPFIIGSHTSYRTAAVREIGGFQPTRAEDHLDTLVLAVRGYRGVFVPEPIAVGAGPETFETYLRQQFAWARSIIQVLFGHSSRLLWRLRPKQALQFLFAETWYPLWSSSLLILFVMPVASLLTGFRPTNASLPEFLLMVTPVTALGAIFRGWTRRWRQPRGLRYSWRGMLLDVARWPIVFWALLNVSLRIRHPYMITPKGQKRGAGRLSLRSHVLYVTASWASAGSVVAALADPAHAAEVNHWASGIASGTPAGLALLSLWGSAFMAAVFAADVLTHGARLKAGGASLVGVLKRQAAPLLTLATTLCLLALGTASVVGPLAEWWRGQPWLDTQLNTSVTMPFVSFQEANPVGDVAPANQPPEIAPMALEDQPAPAVGAYDPWHALTNLPLAVDHFYVRQDDATSFDQALAAAANRRTALVTVEPFARAGVTAPVLDLVAAGALDADLRALAGVARAHRPQAVYLRWGHEMELSGLYPWAANNPALYRAAFRHVVDVFRAEGADNVRWVWSPAGVSGAAAFYPGDDVVDYAGLTILGDAGWDAGFGLPPQEFGELLRPKYEVVAGLGKPILLCEVGVSGTRERQARWLAGVGPALNEFPLVRGLVYFDAVNSPNPQISRRPDWRVQPEAIERLAAALTWAGGSRSVGA